MVRSKHAQIREWLEELIYGGELSIGDRLPTEVEIMDRFQVSRNPVQTAMAKLVENGLIQRRRGGGTIVASSGMRSNLLRVLNASKNGPEVEGDHRLISTRVMSTELHPLSKGHLAPGIPAVEILRTKLDGTGSSMILERAVIDLTLAPDILSQDLVTLTTAAYYHSLGVDDILSHSTVTAAHATPEDAALLDISPTTPVLRQLRTLRPPQGKPFEVLEMIFHPEKLVMEVSQIENGH